MVTQYSICLLLLITLIACPVMAQDSAFTRKTGLIEGMIFNGSTQEPIAGAKIELVGKKLGAISNTRGKFTMKNVPAGVYSLKVSALGYESVLQSDIFVGTGKPLTVNIALQPAVIQLQAAEVEASYFRKNAETITSTQLLNAEDIRRAPGVQEDVVRAVALLPGVAVTSAGRNDLAVRGGAPFENLFMVDNIEVPNINHFGSQGSTGGPLSIINIDFVRDVSFSTGGFGAKYGDRVSSVTNLTLRDGNEERFSGKLNLSATGFGMYVEGPVGNIGSYLFGIRRSYLDVIFKAAGFGFIPEYWDLTGKVSLQLNNNNYLSFLTIGALGTVSFTNDTEEKRINNSRITAPEQQQYFSGITWKSLFPNGFFTVTLGRTFTRYQTEQNIFRRAPVSAGSNDSITTITPLLRANTVEGETSLRGDVIVQASPSLELSAGIISKFAPQLLYDVFIKGTTRLDDMNIPRELVVDTSFGAFRLASYGQAAYTLNEHWKTTVGARIDYYNFIGGGTTVFSPRFALTFSPLATQFINLSAGRYYQAPQYIWLLGDKSNAATLKPIVVDQIVLGYEYIAASDLKLQIEVYTKLYGNYPARIFRPQAVLAPAGFDDVTNDIPFGLEPLSSAATGRSMGVELFLQKKLSQIPLYGLISLSFNQTTFTSIDGVERAGSFDTPITFNCAAGYRFDDEWELSGKVRAATGLPTTPFIQTTERSQQTGKSIGALDFDQYNAGTRLRRFYALDVRLDKRWYLPGVQLVTYLDIQNITGRKNQTNIRWDAQNASVKLSESIGILPSIGVSVEF